MRRGMAIGVLAALLAAWLAGGGHVVGDALNRLQVAAVARAKEAELAAAYPAIQSWGGYRRLAEGPAANSRRARAGRRRAARVQRRELTPEQVTSWGAWNSMPEERRWALYSGAPSWRPVRLITRGVTLCALALIATAWVVRTRGPGLGRLLALPFYLPLWLWQIRRLRPGASHGSAGWADERTVRELTPRRGEVPFVVGRKGSHTVALSERMQHEHAFLVAPPGEGKTTTQIIPNLLREPGTRSLLISDRKRELIRACAPQLRRAGHEVWVADWMSPGVSRAYNPLAYITDSYQAELFADAWVANTGTSSREPFWDQMSSMLIAGAALHLVATETDPETGQAPPLRRLREILVESTPDEVAAILEHSPVAGELAVLLETMAANERLLGSVFTGLAPRFRALKTDAIRRTTSANEIDFGRMAREPVALFLGFDFEDKELLAPLNAAFFLHFFLTANREARENYGELPTPIQCYLDEFGNLGKIPHFDSYITTIRSTGIGVFLVLQSLQQLDKLYGEADATTIKQSCSTKMALGRLTDKDARYFVELAGKTTAVSRSKSVSRQTDTVFAGSGNRSEAEIARDLVTADELRTMRRKVLVISGTLDPVLVEQRPYYEDPKLRPLVPRPMGRRLPGLLPNGGRRDALREMAREKLGLSELLAPAPAGSSTGVGPTDEGATRCPERRFAKAGEISSLLRGDVPVLAPATTLASGDSAPPTDRSLVASAAGSRRGDRAVSGRVSPGKPTPHEVDAVPPARGGAAAPTVRDGPADVERPSPSGTDIGPRADGPGARAAGAGPETAGEDMRVLDWLAQGLSEAKIAMRLGVGMDDVGERVARLRERFGAPDDEALREMARARGLNRATAE